MISTGISEGVVLEEVHCHVQEQILLAPHILLTILLLGLWESF